MYESRPVIETIIRIILSTIAIVTIMACTACTSLRKEEKPLAAACSRIDWFEMGRNDGSLGHLPETRLQEHRNNCAGGVEPNEELYLGGWNAGLVTYCTSTMGFETGKSGMPYYKVCPSHLEGEFLSYYELGTRIRSLETENSDLESRIDSLVRLLAPGQAGPSVRSQLDMLKARRAQNESQLDDLEAKAPQENL